MLQPLQR